ncbi:MAG: HAD family hydrolase [Saprospiraceae bacterium]|nr:HAD family hydrolase [Saprospiraceae bacterium]
MTIKYIFFDCFNTLIDDFDEAGDESGMRPLAHIPVAHGLYEREHHFHDDYLAWRKEYWANGNSDEVLLADRLANIFMNQMRRSGRKVEVLPVIEEMLRLFHEVFPTTIRKSPTVNRVLESMRGRIPMAVVSNFFLPDYPQYLLEQHGLHHYFDFIIDSAQIMVKKPGREIYIEAMNKAGITSGDTSEVLFIGDNLKNDVLLPIEMGMQAWYFDRSGERPSSPAPKGVTSFNSWEQLGEMLEDHLRL